MNIGRWGEREVHLTLMGFWISGNENKLGRMCFFTEVDISKRLRCLAFRKVVCNNTNVKHKRDEVNY